MPQRSRTLPIVERPSSVPELSSGHVLRCCYPPPPPPPSPPPSPTPLRAGERAALGGLLAGLRRHLELLHFLPQVGELPRSLGSLQDLGESPEVGVLTCHTPGSEVVSGSVDSAWGAATVSIRVAARGVRRWRKGRRLTESEVCCHCSSTMSASSRKNSSKRSLGSAAIDSVHVIITSVRQHAPRRLTARWPRSSVRWGWGGGHSRPMSPTVTIERGRCSSSFVWELLPLPSKKSGRGCGGAPSTISICLDCAFFCLR
jgi:hypothetical protein